MAGILLHQKQRHPLGRQLAQDLKNLLHHQRRQPQARLIQQQQARSAHQRPGDGQHLLLAAGEGHRPLSPPLFQPGEQLVHSRLVLGLIAVANGNGPHQQILLDGHIGKDAPPFRGLGDAVAGDKVGRFPADRLPAIENLPAGNARLAEDRHQQR